MAQFSILVLMILMCVNSSTASIPLSTIPSLYDYCQTHHCIHSSTTNYSPSDVLNKHIKLFHGSIVNLQIDAIVNAANFQLKSGRGVCGVIHSAAGPELERASIRKGPIQPGQTVVTRSFDLQPKIKYVFHTVGPDMRQSDQLQQGDELLQSAYESALSQLDHLGLSSIAFPCLSTGIYGFDQTRAANIALKTVRQWMDHQMQTGKPLPTIVFVTFDDNDSKIYKSKLSHYFPLTLQCNGHRRRSSPSSIRTIHLPSTRLNKEFTVRFNAHFTDVSNVLQIVKGNLFDQRVDAVVVPTGPDFCSSRGQIASTLNRIAGQLQIDLCQQALAQQLQINSGNRLALLAPTVDTMRASWIIYTNMLDGLARSYKAALGAANQPTSIRAVAFPLIGTGATGINERTAALIAIKSIKQWLQTRPNHHHFNRILLVANTGHHYTILR